MKRYKIAVLDDYQNAAFESADWPVLGHRADIAVFQDHLADPEAMIERLRPFDVICVMRERSPLPRNIIERLPNLKLIASTGTGNPSIDVAAAADHGIAVVHTGYRSDPAIEFTWTLILASTRHIVTESNSVRSGGWQQTVGADLRGKTLGVLGLGRIGSEVARIGRAFGMNLIAWSENMTPRAADAAGAILVSKNQLFEQADILTIHVVLSSRSRGLIGAAELARMKPTARLINTSRGPIVEEQALNIQGIGGLGHPFAQRWHLNRHYIQPIQEIFRNLPSATSALRSPRCPDWPSLWSPNGSCVCLR
jgi:phosphoglycerate dehydrogenase-like enzyme